MKRQEAISGLWAVALVLSAIRVADAAPVRCEITSKFQCTSADGCAPVAANNWNEIDLEKSTITRCDIKGCDTYGASISTSGIFYNISVPARGLMAKLSADGLNFVEFATLGEIAFVSFGYCRQR
jgi:hypothetical protein